MPFLIEGDKRSPKIEAHFERGFIEISGISLPENPYNFYLPLQKEIENYVAKPKNKTLLSIKLEYFNTGSALALRNTIQKLHDNLPKESFTIKWYYEKDDTDMFDSGEEFSALFEDSNFEIIEVDEF